MSTFKIYNDDCFKVLSQFTDNYGDVAFTSPPITENEMINTNSMMTL